MALPNSIEYTDSLATMVDKMNGIIDSYHDHANISVLNKLGEFMGNLTYDGITLKGIDSQVIAEEFTSGKTYHKNDMVIRGNKLYKKKSEESQPNPYVFTPEDGTSLGKVKGLKSGGYYVSLNVTRRQSTAPLCYGGLVDLTTSNKDADTRIRVVLVTKYTQEMSTSDSQSVHVNMSHGYFSSNQIIIDGITYLVTDGTGGVHTDLNCTDSMVDTETPGHLVKIKNPNRDDGRFQVPGNSDWKSEELVRTILQLAFDDWNPNDWEEVSVGDMITYILSNLGDSHTHANKSILDKLDEYAGNLVYDGNVLKSLNSEIIASEYDPEKTYHLNDIVIRGGALYKRITEESKPNPYYFTTSDALIAKIICQEGAPEYDPSIILPEVPSGVDTTAEWRTTTDYSFDGVTVFGGVVRVDFEVEGQKPGFMAILMSPNSGGCVTLKQRFNGGSWGDSLYEFATVLGTDYYVSFNTYGTIDLQKNPAYYTGASIIDCTDLGYNYQKIYERIVKTATDTFNPAEWRQISIGGELKELLSSNHTHTNKATLDKLNEYKGNLTYNGVSIKGIADQVIAEEFDSTKEYHKDDLVMRTGKLYKKKSDESQPNPYVYNTSAGGGTICIGGARIYKHDGTTKTVYYRGRQYNNGTGYTGLIGFNTTNDEQQIKWRNIRVSSQNNRFPMLYVDQFRTEEPQYVVQEITIDGTTYFYSTGSGGDRSQIIGERAEIFYSSEANSMGYVGVYDTSENEDPDATTEQMIRDLIALATDAWNPNDWEETSVVEELKNGSGSLPDNLVYTSESEDAPDVPSSESSTIYSTEEQVVGKWVDGKPLYQKTYVDTTASLEQLSPLLFDSGIEFVALVQCRTYDTVNDCNQHIPCYQNFNTILSYDVSDKGIAFYVDSAFGLSRAIGVQLTIQYTKTSDVATNTASTNAKHREPIIVGGGE